MRYNKDFKTGSQGIPRVLHTCDHSSGGRRMGKVQDQYGLLKMKTGGRAQEERQRLRVSGSPRTETTEGTVKPKLDGHLCNMSPVLGALHAYLIPRESHWLSQSTDTRRHLTTGSPGTWAKASVDFFNLFKCCGYPDWRVHTLNSWSLNQRRQV